MRRVSVVCLLVVCFILILRVTNAIESEGDALRAFKNALTDPSGNLKSWGDDEPCSFGGLSWVHITCNEQDQVTRIDLGNQGLSGPLVSDLTNLAGLQYLVLYQNNLSGPIPSSFGNLSNLVQLNLHDNQFTGDIPPELCNLKNLHFLQLYNNKLRGTEPQACTNIPVVNLTGNSGLCGPDADYQC